MNEQAVEKTVKYVGATPDEAQRRYAEGSARAVAAGWRVARVDWESKASQPTLSATYVPAPIEQPPATSSNASVHEEPPAETPASRWSRGVGRKGLWAAVALVALVIVAYAVLFGPERTDTTPEPETPPGSQVGKYEQTWAKDYDATTCAEFVERMDGHERWVMAAEYLLEAHRAGDSAAPIPPDSQVDLMTGAIDAACEGIAAERDIGTTEVARSLIATRVDLQPAVENAAITADPTPQPTPKPTPRPTPKPTPKPLGFGTRASVVSYVEGLGFTGSRNDLTDGRQRWLGRHRDGHIAEVIGTASHVTELSLTTAISDSIDSGGEIAGLLLAKYAPGSHDWVGDNLVDAVLGDSPSRRFGEVKVSLSGLAAADGSLLIIGLER
jgi:hypothetical protein